MILNVGLIFITIVAAFLLATLVIEERQTRHAHRPYADKDRATTTAESFEDLSADQERAAVNRPYGY